MAGAHVGAATYRIADEPSPGRLARFAVSPIWPMLATMLAGSWLGTPWFVFNAFALGSATRRRELAWAVGTLLLSAAMLQGFFLAAEHELLPMAVLRYGSVLVTAVRLTGAYFTYGLQDASFELHRYFGGPVVNGAPLLIVGMLAPSHRFFDPLLPYVGKLGVLLLNVVLG
jgi:hypothetical protein